MEKTLDLKLSDLQELGKEELKSVAGGGFLLNSLYNAFPGATIMVLTALAIDRDVIEGIGQGWSENKK